MTTESVIPQTSPAADWPAGRRADRRAWLRWSISWLAVTVGLVAWRYEMLASPPYWDCTIGLWTEANFLAETDFDYHRLRYDEKSVWQGGAKSYVISALPTLIAVGMRWMPSATLLLVVSHLVSIGCAAGVLLAVFALAWQTVGRLGAVLAAAAVLSTPLFSVQIDMLGMELPLTLFALLSALLLLRGRFVWAAVFSTVAFAMKPTGGLLTLAAIVYLALLLATAPRDARQSRRRYAWGLAANAAAWAVQLAVIHWGGTVATLMQARYQHAMATLWGAVFWCPDLVALFSIIGAGSAVVLRRLWIARRAAHPALSFMKRATIVCGELVRRRSLFVLSWIVVLGTLFAIMRISFLPRYLVIAVPFLQVILATLLFQGERRRLGIGAFTLLIALNLANARGRFFPSLDVYPGPKLARSGALLERSRAYLDDHRANLEAIDRIVTDEATQPIIAARPHVDFLAMPRLGYVDRPLHGLAVNRYSDLQKTFHTLSIHDEPLPAHPIVIDVDNTWSRLSSVFEMPPPGEYDRVIFNDHGNPPLVVYQKGWPVEPPSRREVDDWYLRHLWPNARATDRCMFHIAWLARHRRTDDALHEARQAVSTHPRDFYLRQWLFDLYLSRGELEAAAWTMLAAFPGDPRRTSAEYADDAERGYAPDLADILPPSDQRVWRTWTIVPQEVRAGLQALRRGEMRLARRRWASVDRHDRAFATAAVLLGSLALSEEFPSEAVEHCQHAIAATEALPATAASKVARLAAQDVLARTWLHQGELGKAAQQAESTVALDAEYSLAWATLGLVRLRQGAIEKARQSFRRCLELDPDNHEAAEGLKRLGSQTELGRVP